MKTPIYTHSCRNRNVLIAAATCLLVAVCAANQASANAPAAYRATAKVTSTQPAKDTGRSVIQRFAKTGDNSPVSGGPDMMQRFSKNLH